MVTGGGDADRRKAVFLDRDGILSVPEFRAGRSYAVRSLKSFALYPDAAPSLQRLKGAGFALVVVTNQPDVGAGLISPQILSDMHRILRHALPIDHIETCIHRADQGCACRKPHPGMLLRASEILGIAMPESFMVGDRASDVEAGQRAGCRTAFRDLGYTAEATPGDADFRSPSLPAIVDWILSVGGNPLR